MIKSLSKILVLTIVFVGIVSAFSFSHADLANMMSQVHQFENIGKNGNAAANIGDVVDPIVDIGSILTTIGAAVMIGVVLYMGIKYLTSGPDARAKLKVQLIGVLVAGLVIFGAYYIWDFVVNVASKL